MSFWKCGSLDLLLIEVTNNIRKVISVDLDTGKFAKKIYNFLFITWNYGWDVDQIRWGYIKQHFPMLWNKIKYRHPSANAVSYSAVSLNADFWGCPKQFAQYGFICTKYTGIPRIKRQFWNFYTLTSIARIFEVVPKNLHSAVLYLTEGVWDTGTFRAPPNFFFYQS